MKRLLIALLIPLASYGGQLTYTTAETQDRLDGNYPSLSVTGEVAAAMVQMDIAFEDGVAEGRLQWNSDDGTLEFGLPGGNVNLQVGQEQLMRVTNKSGSDISNGVPVYISGAQGSRPTIEPAKADVYSASRVCGVTTEPIDDNMSGYVNTFGIVRGVDTSEWTAGDILYLSDTAGVLTNVSPAYPSEPTCVGLVLFSNAESGSLFVKPTPSITYDVLSDTPLIVKSLEYSGTNIYNDLRFPFATVDLPGLGADPSPAVISNCIYTLVFAQNDYLFFSPQMSHDYWDGTVLRPHVHSISTGTSITNTFNLVYSYADIGAVFAAPKTNTVTIATSGVSGEHELHNLGTMDALGTIGGTEVSSMVGVKLIRTDTGTGINLLEFDIHYRIRYAGGQEYTP